jgi:glycosyltransferase involved in cell wall biosynthesis
MKLAIVIPCFNEEAVLPEAIKRLDALLVELLGAESIAKGSHVLFVDDGSKDKTWSIIEQATVENPCIKGIKLSRNRGHQTALIAGLLSAEGDAIISVDADLQDDLNAMVQMISAYQAGADIVYGVRKRRDTDTFFKRDGRAHV